MLVLPIKNKNHIYNVGFRLRGCELVKESASYDDAGSEDIIVNRTNFKNSLFDNNDDKAESSFIRSKYLNNSSNNNSFLVTTKYRSDKQEYNVYRILKPTRKVNDSLEKLYSQAIRDLRKEIPKSKKENPHNRGRYVSLKKLGLDEDLSNSKIATLQKLSKAGDLSKDKELLKKNGVYDLKGIVDFISKNFEMSVNSEDIIDENAITTSRQFFSKLYTKEYKSINSYYETAKQNTDIFTTISYVNKLIYGEPLKIQLASGKELVKKKGEVDSSDKN